ncbi:hypothetical protein N1851_029746 [Merluccius polli]|uniref:Uncharacterized protein n=1 Tax=Merluccius polli TaxID=89951 RepID=A0AA47M6M9_MERPO|nr:hypothetical protein N1851_029746 [Merluccius polli]
MAFIQAENHCRMPVFPQVLMLRRCGQLLTLRLRMTMAGIVICLLSCYCCISCPLHTRGKKKTSSAQAANHLLRFLKKAVPCKAQTSVAAFDVLFKAHYVFSLSYDEALSTFYTFIQTTMYIIDVGNAKETPRIKEMRARLLQDH